MMRIIREMKRVGIEVISETTPLYCKVLEDNSGAIEMAKSDKYRPRKKHLNIKYHHFSSYIGKKKGGISIHKIDTTNQIADLLTKPLQGAQFRILRDRILNIQRD